MSNSQQQDKNKGEVVAVQQSSLVQEDGEGSPRSEARQQPTAPRSKNMWSRVICVSKATDEDLEVWRLEDDLDNRTLDLPKRKPKSHEPWAPIFSGADFLADEPVLELEHHALKDRKLRMLG